MDTNVATSEFDNLVASGMPVGEVIAVNSFMVKIKGLHPVNIGSLVVFETGSRGFVQRVLADHVEVLYMGTDPPMVGAVVTIKSNQLITNVGTGFIGRVIGPDGRPLDGKGPITADAGWKIFNAAPKIHEREQLNELIETGVTVIDSLFPIVRGQRLAVIGDGKSGKSSLVTQIGINQKDTGAITIYVLIAKRKSEIDALIAKLESSGAMESSIVVVSTIFDPLVSTYLAPYLGCAIGEYLWQVGERDVVIIYDDLTSHAQIYREISLVSRVNPGRDTYPGDIFYIHSSLLERAGKLHRSHKSMTAIPVVLAAGGDITAYLPTNIISITDGQWILDNEIFHSGVRPAISSGLSVTRVGGRGHSDAQKYISSQTLKAIAAYKRALEFSHFGSEMAANTARELRIGQQINEIITQLPGEHYSLPAQRMMLDIVLAQADGEQVSVTEMKRHVNGIAKTVDDQNYEIVRESLKSMAITRSTA